MCTAQSAEVFVESGARTTKLALEDRCKPESTTHGPWRRLGGLLESGAKKGCRTRGRWGLTRVPTLDLLDWGWDAQVLCCSAS